MNKEGPPLIPSILLKLLLRGEDYYEFSDDLDEIYRHRVPRDPKWRAKAWYWFRVLESVPRIILDKMYWRVVMLKNYFKISLRNFLRHKGYSFINLAGFSIGMACCLLIFVHVRHELSYDKYQRDVERIYRIVQDIRSQTSSRDFAYVSPMVGPTLKAEYPQVETAARAIPASNRLVKQEMSVFYEDRFMYADQELFDIFTIPFIMGNPDEALTKPQALVISQKMAHKYFGHENPLGKPLTINEREYEITGVVANSPENTHLKYDLIASMETIADWSEMSNWYSTMFLTYLKLKPNVDMEEFSRKVSHLADPYVEKRLRSRGITYNYILQPLSRIHLHSHTSYEYEPPGNPIYVYIFSFVGFFILLIASLNFMNLSTARAANRAKEVGMRKLVGAQRLQLMGQFLGESLIVALLSLGLAIVIAKFTIPLIDNLIGTTLSFESLLNPAVLVSLIGGSILFGIAAGIYPAFVLSAFKPIATFKGIPGGGARSFSMRTVLVVAQFTISVVLIVGTLIMYKQFHFMKNQHLGFEKEQKLILPLRGGISIQDNYEEIKDLFSKHPTISGATASSSVPGRPTSSFSISLVGEEDQKVQDMFHLYFEHDFIYQYGIEMMAGRNFQKEMSTDTAGAFLINEAAVKAFGWKEPEESLGKRLRSGHGGRVNPIIGVTKNFHYRGLQTEVEPLIMEILPRTFRCITLSVNTFSLKETMAFVESQWKVLFPGYPYESFFLDTDFDRQYRADEQVGRIFGLFTFLGLFIACLGLVGLTSFTTETRTKEIGIRKVLGASVGGIVLMLSKQFTKWMLLANIIAWPIAYYFMSRWLKNFAFRTHIDIMTFLLSGILVLAIALLTVSFQSIKAATANPADSLRYE